MDDDELLDALGRYQRDLNEREVESPMSDEDRDSALDGAFARLGAMPGESEAESGPEPEEETEAAPAPISLADRRSRTTAVAMLGVVLAVAAAVLLWWGRRAPAPADPPLIASIPSYSLTQLRAGSAAQRGDAPTVPSAVESSASDRIELVLTPATPTTEPVGLAIVARPDAGATIVANPTAGVQISEDGGVRLSGSLDQFVELSEGHWTLELLLGPPGALPRDAAGLAAAPSPPPWRTLTIEVTIVASDR